MKPARLLKLVLLMFLLATAPAWAQQQTPDELAIPRLSLELFNKLHAASRIVIIDVRPPQLYSQGHIPGAISVTVDGISARAAELKKHGKPIVAYCT